MPAVVKLSLKELDQIISDIEAAGGDAEELKKIRAGVADEKWLKKVAKPLGEEEYLEEKRGQSSIEHGTDLECTICHNKFDHLISGTCEACFREWMLSTRPRS